MKKMFVICFVLLLNFFVKAQHAIIPKLGVTISSANVDPEVGDQQSKQSILFGLGFEAKLNDLLSIQPEVLYIKKGASWKMSFADAERTISYLEIPLMLKLNARSGQFKFYVNAGPSISFALKGENTGSLFGVSGTSDIKFGDEDGKLKAIDLSLQAGGGLGYHAGPGVALIDVRYGFGLTNLENSNNTYKNKAVAITVGYSFPLSSDSK